MTTAQKNHRAIITLLEHDRTPSARLLALVALRNARKGRMARIGV